MISEHSQVTGQAQAASKEDGWNTWDDAKTTGTVGEGLMKSIC